MGNIRKKSEKMKIQKKIGKIRGNGEKQEKSEMQKKNPRKKRKKFGKIAKIAKKNQKKNQKSKKIRIIRKIRKYTECISFFDKTRVSDQGCFVFWIYLPCAVLFTSLLKANKKTTLS